MSILIKRLDLFFSKSVKNAMRLASSSLSASLISFAGMIFIVRLYQIEDIGHFALITSVSQFIPIFFTLRLELAMMNVQTDREVSAIFVSALSLIAIFSLIAIIISLFLIQYESINEVYSRNIIIILFIFLVVSVNNLLIKALNRYRKYSYLAAQLFFYTFILNISQITLGYVAGENDGFKNLLLGMLLATIASFIILTYGTITAKLSIIRSFNPKLLFSTIYLHKTFPLFNVPHSVVSKSSSEAPVFIIMTFFGSEIVGFFSLARKALSQPIYIVGKNIGLIFHERMGHSVRSNNGNASYLFKKTMLFMSLIILPFSFLILLFVEDLFFFVFGAEWVFSGTLSKLLLPLMIMRFLAAPLEYIFLLTNNSMQLLIIHLAKTILGIFGLMIGVYLDNVISAIFLYSIFSCVIYGYSIFKAQKVSKMPQGLTKN